MIPSRNVWHPKGRVSAKPAPLPEPLDQDAAADIDQGDAELTDVAEEDAELSDADFYRQLRRDVAGCREGCVPSITDAMRPALKDRPWSPKRKRRDRYGRAF